MNKNESYEFLSRFCSKDVVRVPITEPFTKGEFSFATCGRIIVAVPKIEGIVGHENAPDPSVTGIPFGSISGTSVSKPIIPTLEFNECPKCEGSGYFECNCPDCPYCEHHCDKCAGSGKMAKMQRVEIGDRDFNAHLLALLDDMDNLRFYTEFKEGESGVLPFTFDGGCGGIIPLRKEEDHA